MSSFAFFFALFVIPSNASISPGVVRKGSNSKRWPSAVGTDTKAATDFSSVSGLATFRFGAMLATLPFERIAAGFEFAREVEVCDDADVERTMILVVR